MRANNAGEMEMPQAKLTKAFVDSLPFSDSGTIWYHDTKLPGLQLSVGRTTKTFFASAEFNRKLLRVKLGRADVMEPNVARKEARDTVLPALRQGEDPRPPKPVKLVKVEPAPKGPETFWESFERYRRDGTSARASTLQEYERLLRTKVPDWLDPPTATIAKQDVRARYRLIAVGAPVAAQAVMRVVSAVMRHAAEEEVIEASPVILKKGWSVPRRCKERIGDVAAWWRQVDDLNGQMAAKTVLKLVLLTGLRPGELLSLRWQDVDLAAGKVHIRNPKRGPARDAALSTWSIRQLDRLARLKARASGYSPRTRRRGTSCRFRPARARRSAGPLTAPVVSGRSSWRNSASPTSSGRPRWATRPRT